MNIFSVFDQEINELTFDHYTFAGSGFRNPDSTYHKSIREKKKRYKNSVLRPLNFQSEANLRIPHWLLRPYNNCQKTLEKAIVMLSFLCRFFVKQPSYVASDSLLPLHLCRNSIIKLLLMKKQQDAGTHLTAFATCFFLGFSDFKENELRNNCRKTALKNKLISHSSQIFRKGKTIFGIVFGDQPNLYRQKIKGKSISAISIDINLRKTTIYYEIQMSGEGYSEFETIFNIKKFGIQSANTHSLYDKELPAESQTLCRWSLI
ncbi:MULTISPECIES: hypothetical protein [unclassified Sphingobacterium]|uniref:hypothetical protein n=1 Tax=unclassified Sphingobacterium TaxID=2609468 RepID=UPI0025E1476D|nr:MULTISPECIES: hypothetical protein [unclassified Sphingobacterium]